MKKNSLLLIPLLLLTLACTLVIPVQFMPTVTLTVPTATPTITSTPTATETPTPTPTETPTPTPTVLLPGDILYSDDFSNPDSGWDRVRDEIKISDYENGGYRMWLNQKQYDMWANPGKQFTMPVRIEVDVTKSGGPDDNAFGLICDYQDVANFYYGEISSDGYAIIGKVQAGKSSYLSATKMQPVSGINTGDSTNHIRLDCINGTLTLYANDKKVAETNDSTFSTGDVGLQVSTFTEVGVDLLFHNFVVKFP